MPTDKLDSATKEAIRVAYAEAPRGPMGLKLKDHYLEELVERFGVSQFTILVYGRYGGKRCRRKE